MLECGLARDSNGCAGYSGTGIRLAVHRSRAGSQPAELSSAEMRGKGRSTQSELDGHCSNRLETCLTRRSV